MTQHTIYFVDPTMPGISGRDLIERAIKSVHAFHLGSADRNPARSDRALRQGLARLDRNLLRDLGLDRGAC